MFIGFFQLMRAQGIKVSLTEWMSLMAALAAGLDQASLEKFYYLCRSLCVKSETKFDRYDQCFAHYFQDLDFSQTFHDELATWLKNPQMPRELTVEEKAQLRELDLEELRQRFLERLAEQKERHDGGSRWIGTGGTSPFGHGGFHPSGLRMGGAGRLNQALQVASQRKFSNLRSDLGLDTRSISAALRKLRILGRDGLPTELDLPSTITATGANAGEITMVFRPERRNSVHLLLLMDVGGSMTPYTQLTERLFSAAHQMSHFKSFRYFYFHNTPYETLYSDMNLGKGQPTKDILRELDSRWYILLVGDAAMSPYELTVPGGSVDYFHNNEEPGVVWLQRIRAVTDRVLWFNPEPRPYWQRTSTQIIRQIFPMYPLSVQGIEDGMDYLKRQNQGVV